MDETRLHEGQAALVLTRRGRDRIAAELDRLLDERREISELIRHAKDFGEVGENAEYEHAKSDQARVEARIAELKRTLGTARVLDPSEVRTDRVSLGSVVQLQDEDIQEDWEVTVVGSAEADPEEDRISDECPMGQALMHRKPGDSIEVTTPGGTIRYRILSIHAPKD